MATADEERQSQPGTYKEAEKLLEMAERLEKECLEQEGLISRLGMIELTIVGVVISVMVSVWAIENVHYTIRILTVPIVTIYLTWIGWFFWQLIRRRTKQLHKNQRALFELLSMLREIEQAVAERNNVSAIERAEFRIRLSRFDIGPEYFYAQRGRG